jgi:hypothetical protein
LVAGKPAEAKPRQIARSQATNNQAAFTIQIYLPHRKPDHVSGLLFLSAFYPFEELTLLFNLSFLLTFKLAICCFLEITSPFKVFFDTRYNFALFDEKPTFTIFRA